MLSFDKNYIIEYSLGLMPYLSFLCIVPFICANCTSQTWGWDLTVALPEKVNVKFTHCIKSKRNKIAREYKFAPVSGIERS